MEERYPVAYNLGCGQRHWDGWTNVDISGDVDIKADLRRLGMIASDSADAVAAIHVLEHFYYWEAEPLLTEWKRILKPGGKLILELPCMDKVFAYVIQCMQKGEGMAPFMTLHAFYGDPRHGLEAMCHRWGWFSDELDKMLNRVGFREVRACDPRYHFRFRDMRFEAIK